MATDPNQPTPNETDAANSRREPSQGNPSADSATPDQAARPQTQGNMGDGTGQRGGYGDSDQPNGMEGGPESAQQGTAKEQDA